MNHLTDEQIQEFLHKKNEIDEVKFKKHIETCAHCKKQVEAYKQVFSSLEKEPDFVLPVNFVDKVFGAIETNEDKKYKKWENILLLFSILQGIGFAVYFLNFKKIFSIFSFDFSNLFKSTVEQITGIGNGFLPILIFALIILTFYGFLDRFINQIKHQSS